MLLKKTVGGCSLTWDRVTYSWDADGDVTEVPAELGAMLLAIRGGGYEVVDSPSRRQLAALKAKADAEAAARAEAEAAAAAELAAKGDGPAADDGQGVPKEDGAPA